MCQNSLSGRSYLGLSLAASQAVHGVFVVWLAAAHPVSFWSRVALSTVAGGALSYVFLALMTATSFDRGAAWLGRRRWRALHTTGMYYLYVVFVFSYAPRATSSPIYAASSLALAAALAVRIAAALSGQSATRLDGAPPDRH